MHNWTWTGVRRFVAISVAFVALLILSVLLITDRIDCVKSLFLAISWGLFCFLVYVGPETITEVTFLRASIKRDLAAAREIRDEIEGVRQELRGIVRVIVEDTYILASCSFLAAGAEQAARTRLEQNWDTLSEFAEPIKARNEKWWDELEELFAHRKQLKAIASTETGYENAQNNQAALSEN